VTWFDPVVVLWLIDHGNVSRPFWPDQERQCPHAVPGVLYVSDKKPEKALRLCFWLSETFVAADQDDHVKCDKDDGGNGMDNRTGIEDLANGRSEPESQGRPSGGRNHSRDRQRPIARTGE
jgi:hypothetical protein